MGVGVESLISMPESHDTTARPFGVTLLDGPIADTLGRPTPLMFLLHAFVLLFGFFHVLLLDGFDEILRDLNAFLEIHKEGRGASTLNVFSLLPGRAFSGRAFSSLPLRGHGLQK